MVILAMSMKIFGKKIQNLLSLEKKLMNLRNVMIIKKLN